MQRPDDEPETVRRRLRVYRRETAPLIAWYEDSPARMSRVDATRSVADVNASFRAAVGEG
jgi:adenylate kinase